MLALIQNSLASFVPADPVAPTFRGTGLAFSNGPTGDTTLFPTLPEGFKKGDLFLCVVVCMNAELTGAPIIAIPSGWSALSPLGTATNHNSRIHQTIYRFAESGAGDANLPGAESSPHIRITASGGTTAVCSASLILLFRGVRPPTSTFRLFYPPFVDNETGGQSTWSTFAPFFTIQQESMALRIMTNGSRSFPTSPITGTAPFTMLCNRLFGPFTFSVFNNYLSIFVEAHLAPAPRSFEPKKHNWDVGVSFAERGSLFPYFV